MQRRTCLLVTGMLAVPPSVRAQSWPERPVRIVQGFAVGGNGDAVARAVAAELTPALGQTVLVEAIPGAGGSLASAAIARARPDGYNLLLATGAHSVAGALYEKLPYDTVASFEMVTTVTQFPLLVVAGGASRHGSLREALAAARAAPGRLTYGSAGVGSTNHLAMELLLRQARVEMLHVPYRGAAAAIAPLIAGDIDLLVTPATSVLGNLRAGKLRALAVTGAQRWAGMNEIPTAAEQGVPDYDVRSWAGLMAPAGTPRAVLDRLRAAMDKALQQPAFRSKLEVLGGEPLVSTPSEFKALVESDLHKWQQVVRDARIPRESALAAPLGPRA